jgi:hypothetical protein
MSNSRAKKAKVNAPRVAATRSQRNSSRSTAAPATSAAESAQTSTSAAAPAAMNKETIAAIVSRATGKAAEMTTLNCADNFEITADYIYSLLSNSN